LAPASRFSIVERDKMNLGERQVSETVDGIRRDHVARYEWAAKTLPPGSHVVDVACGVGYGSKILAEAGHIVVAVDIDLEAITYAQQHYSHKNIRYACSDILLSFFKDEYDAVVMFEAIEHIEDPLPVLKKLAKISQRLLASVPNEIGFPYKNYKYHFRHYTPIEFHGLLKEAGFGAEEWYGQKDAESGLEHGLFDGRTLIVDSVVGATSYKPPAIEPKESTSKHICILGLGPSLEAYVDHIKRLGGRHAFADEVYAINSLGDCLQCDKVFHMDDVRIQEIRAKAEPKSNIANMLGWMKTHPGPIITSRAYDDYPGLVAFPLEEVINSLGYAYFNSTAAYAVAHAIYAGATKISFFGCDFTYPNAHQAEKGRACVEFWMGIAAARGIKIAISEHSTLMDTYSEPGSKLYGYDTVTVDITKDGTVTFTPKDILPTAEEIEKRYDHSVHPNILVKNGKLQSS
jgi:SAM-dependent methyltransferase